jgi:hypothetical protein
MSNGKDFHDYIKEILGVIGVPITDVISETMVSVKISTKGIEENPHDEKMLIELGGTDFSGNPLIEIFSAPEHLKGGTEHSLGPLLLLQNSTPLYAHWAIRKVEGEAYLIASAVASTSILSPSLLKEMIFSVLRRRIDFRKLLKEITDTAIGNLRS